jgi:cell division protease FtsH
LTTFLITFVACLLSSCVAIAAQLFAHHRFYQSQLKAQLKAQELATGGDADEGDGNKAIHVRSLLSKHFGSTPLRNLIVAERKFPERVRIELHRALEQEFSSDGSQRLGVLSRYSHDGLTFAQLIVDDDHYPATVAPVEFEDVEIGEDEPVRCVKSAMWFASPPATVCAVLLDPASRHGYSEGMRVQVATPPDEAGAEFAVGFFKRLEAAVERAEAYRGKVLSLERSNDYSGRARGIKVHRLRSVTRDEVILPPATLELLERNVLRFVERREDLKRLGFSAKKGLLFYGPPGTGKTHTIHYLASALAGHTMLLVTAEQIGLLPEYMTLARLLQPSIVVIEDADLIARNRERMHDGCEEVMLNKLLNEMDGLREDAAILFVLTTNRPESLEAALASRPGRIDQAIEFPPPDEVGRSKLIVLYSAGAGIADELRDDIVRRTEGASPAFLKELMRRSIQFNFEREGNNRLSTQDLDRAIGELLAPGSPLNRLLLAAGSNWVPLQE